MDGIPITDLSAGALVAILVLLIAVGRLVPRATLDRETKNSDYWRAAHMTSEVARAELSRSVDVLLELSRTTDAFIRSLPHQPDGDRPRLADGSSVERRGTGKPST